MFRAYGRMAKRSSAFLLRATVTASDKIRTRRFRWVVPSELMSTWTFRSPVTTLDGELRSTFRPSFPSSFCMTPLTTNSSNCRSQPVVSQRSDSNSFFSLRKNRVWGQNPAFDQFLENRWISLLSFQQQTLECCGYATAAINITEPGKSWRGRGWNCVPVESGEFELTANDTDPSTASQFDAIPDLIKKLEFLATCGLGDSQLEQMRRRLPSAVKNTFLKLPVKKLEEVATFMEEEVGVERKDFGNLLFANPFIAGSRVDDCLRPKVEFLRSRGISKEQMGMLVLRAPQILTYSEGKLLFIEKKLQEIGLNGEEIGTIFLKHPAIVGVSIRKFERNIQALRDGGITELAKAILKLPQIMSLSLDTKIEQIIHYLRDDLKLQQEQIRKIFRSQITILSFSVQDNIRPKVAYFSRMGLQENDIARLLLKYPNLFCNSLDLSIKPKVQYLLEVMKLELVELMCFPQYLSYSLKGRIIPRHEFVTKHGHRYRLSSLLSCGEEVFRKRYPNPLHSAPEDSAVQNI